MIRFIEAADEKIKEDKPLKTVRVVAAVICDSIENKTKIFATARGYGEFKGGWEFPGGKIEAGESPESALAREIREELATEISVGDYIDTIEYDYPAFHLSMRCYECSVVSGKLELLEHENARWLTRETLRSVKWLPADIMILDQVEELL
jgi:8-oxo-dGTP diphosphatase